jgi:NADH:ubiquinone oxidoreductase subunit 2 (subunit N)
VTAFLPTSSEYTRILPEIILTLVGVLIMFLEAITTEKQKSIFAPITILGLAGALIGTFAAYGDPGPAFQNMLVVDGFATFFRVLVIGVGLLAVFSSSGYLRRVLRAHSVQPRRPVHHGVGERAHHDLRRPGDFLHRQLHPRRLPP